MRNRLILIYAVLISLALGPSASKVGAQGRVTSPEKFFGFRLGADRKIARWDRIVEYYRLLEGESGGKLKVVNVGPSTMGNPFLLVIITSPKNMAALERLREVNAKISDPRGLAEADVKPLIAEGRPVRVAKVTVNDLLTAALAGALREELLAAGDRVDTDIRALVPVNLRPQLPEALAGAMGNCFGLVFLELPISAATPADRLAVIRARTEALKRTPDAVVTYAVLDAIGHLPGPVEFFVTEFFSRKASLVVTNVPGPRERLHVAGHELDRMMFNVPHPAALGLGVSILSYAGEVRVGARADMAVMKDPNVFVRRFAGEVAALGAV